MQYYTASLNHSSIGTIEIIGEPQIKNVFILELIKIQKGIRNNGKFDGGSHSLKKYDNAGNFIFQEGKFTGKAG
ncbi:MAG: hypothetical protein JWQ09_3330 [Segetibacter sp.]|nr:hypothetical protein [Segetibacter sp.]